MSKFDVTLVRQNKTAEDGPEFVDNPPESFLIAHVFAATPTGAEKHARNFWRDNGRLDDDDEWSLSSVVEKLDADPE